MDKKLAVLGSVMILLLMGGLYKYQKNQDEDEVVAQTETVEQQEMPETISGYEDEAELIQYMLCQLQNGNLDLALRGCAIQGVAENFNLETYIEYTETYEPLEVLPPSNWESTAYSAISEMRLEGLYTEWLQTTMEELGSAHTVKLYGVEEDVPENPDGKYYENQRTITEILGARSVKEMLIYAEIDGQAKELRWTLTRHGKSWRVLLFTSLDGYGMKVMDIRNTRKDLQELDEISFSTQDILPANYGILNANGEETPELTARKFFRYLMRQDVWSAASYIKVYDGEPHTTVDLMKQQADIGNQMQAFYYRLFFNDQNKYEWYFRDLAARAGDIAEDIRSDKVITMNVNSVQRVSEESDGTVQIQVGYSYGWGGYSCLMTLVNENGWRITNIEWQ